MWELRCVDIALRGSYNVGELRYGGVVMSGCCHVSVSWCVAVAVYRSYNLWELQRGRVAIWTSCSVGGVVMCGCHSMGELHCEIIAVCGGHSGYHTLIHCFLGFFNFSAFFAFLQKNDHYKIYCG